MQITWSGTKKINYLYNVAGQKVKKTVVDGSTTTVTDYLDGFQYENQVLQFFPTAEGYVKATVMTMGPGNPVYGFNYVYNYTDHLGNVRLSYAKDPQTGDLKVMEENHYYPFGLKHNYGSSSISLDFLKQLDDWGVILAPVTNNPYKYKYNGFELQEEFELNWYDYQARNYDPALGRWFNLDPLAETSRRTSPYVYALNNPVFFIDPDGMEAEASSESSSAETGTGFNPVYDTEGNFLGTDDQGLQGKAFVMDKSDFKQGMSHEEAESKNLGSGGLKNVEAAQKLVNHYDTLSTRPDYDGFATVSEGIDWAKEHPGALDNPTPNNTLYLDASKLNFGDLYESDFLSVNKIENQNLLTYNNLAIAAENETVRATAYALGSVNMILTNRTLGTVQIVNDKGTVYDWNTGGSILRSTLISAERTLKGLNDSHGFKTYYYGIGTLNKESQSIPFTPSQWK